MVDKVKQGKKSRASGAAFELRVRKALEEQEWIIDKWSNNVEWYFETKDVVKQENPIGRLHPARRKYLGPGRPMVIGTGFPDFIAIKPASCFLCSARGYETEGNYDVVGIECKTNGRLDKDEKAKCKWMLEKKIFSKIYIAFKTKVKNKIVIEYKEFE